MDGHLEGVCAPQWMDFTGPRSPKVTQDFFNEVHTVEFKQELCDSTLNNIQFASQEDVSPSNTVRKMQDDLRIIKSTPVKMISPNRDNKKLITITYDEVFNNAIKTLEFCQKSSKERDASNKINQESTVFKIPGVSKINKSSRSIGFYNVLNHCQSIQVQSSQDTMLKSESNDKKIKNINMRRTLPSQYLFKQDDVYVKNNASKLSHVRLIDYAKNKEKDRKPNEHSEGLKESNEKLNEKNNEEHEKENNDEFKNESENRNEENNKERQDEFQELTDEDEEGDKQDDVNIIIGKTKLKKFNKRHSFLTWQNHRRTSVYKRRTSINNSSAETIPCFQNETPKRYPARKTKNNTPALFNSSKLMQNRTPISPTLVSKNETRAVTVPSQEKRGKPTPGKKRQIKAKPVPAGVSRMVPKVTKKPANTCSATQSKSGETACATNLLLGKNSPPPAGKTPFGPKNTVLKIAVTNAEGIVVKRQAISFFGVPKENRTKRVTRVQPFSFEARNKELQMKKEQTLKRIQEANVFNWKFRARPAPNFSKPVNASRGRKNVEGTKNAACAEDEAQYREESKKRLEQEKHTKAKLHKLMEVKARPMPKYKPPVVIKSMK